MILRKSNIFIANYLNEDIYDSGDVIVTYDKPFEIGGCILNSLTGSSQSTTEYEMFGERVFHMSKVLLDYDTWFGKVNEKDAVYLYGVTPEGESFNGEKANYRVKAVMPQNVKILVYFERLP